METEAPRQIDYQTIRDKSAELTSDPRKWGALFWTMLIYIALNYPNQPTMAQKDLYRQFYTSIGPVLPCIKCRGNYSEHLAAYPLDVGLEGRVSLLQWLSNIYNAQGKHRPLNLSQFLRKYLPADLSQQLRLAPDQWGGGTGTSLGVVLLGVLILIAAIYYLLPRKR